MTITHELKIDLVRPAILPPVAVVQGDTYTREVQISLYAAGVSWELPEGHDVAIRYSKPDGTAGIYDTLPDNTPAWSSEGNTVTVMLCPQMLTCPGEVPAQVCVIVGSRLISTFAFVVDVEEDPSKGALTSENYHNWRYAFLPQTAEAKVGQYLMIAEVDETGKVVKLVPVDAPAGSGSIDGDLDMKGSMIDNIGTLSLAGPNGDATDGAWMAIDDVIDNEDGTRNPVINHYSNESDSPVIMRNIAPGVRDRDAANVGQLKTRLVAPLTASVGQYIKITAVDDDGKITAVEAVDAPSGNGGGSGVHVGPDEPTDESTTVWIDPDDDKTTVFVEAPATAEVGQVIAVKAIDENGKPIEWETVSIYSKPQIDAIMGSYINDIDTLIGGDS